MNLRATTEHQLFKPALGAALAVLCGLALWTVPLGEHWVSASYDYLFRFGEREVTNRPVLILMDNTACEKLKQDRISWDRALHTELLNRLTDGGCSLVVFDVFFRIEKEAATDAALAEAMRRHGHVVLMAKVTEPQHPKVEPAEVLLPHKLFLEAATNIGIGRTDARRGQTVRRHWPFPAPDEGFLSLPWAAAQLAGAKLNEEPTEQWVRYYADNRAWETFSYHLALSNAPTEFRNKIVFIGSDPESSDPNILEDDKFCIPFRSGSKTVVGGVKIMATTFLNLVNGDWLRRPAGWVEALVLVGAGVLLGGGLCRMHPLVACGLAVGAALAVTLGTASLSYYTNFWFPWLIIVGGQVPCALACALFLPSPVRIEKKPPATIVFSLPAEPPDYKLFEPPFGVGAFGKVWLGRNAIGQWQAIKKVYRANFEDDRPYDMEFDGIRKYKPVSEKHSGLLRVELVSGKKPEGYFYYVMELGDAQEPGWEENPATYKPRTLASLRAQSIGLRLPVLDSVRIGVSLAEALDFLHGHNLTHRDIKPSNVIFVNGLPKLADVGLVTEARPAGQEATRVGTPGYMPPPPEPQGTKQADIYALGMLLYVISTGREPGFFPDLSTTLVERTGHQDFMRLDAIITKACQPDCAQRYSSAAEMRDALRETQQAIERTPTPSSSS